MSDSNPSTPTPEEPKKPARSNSLQDTKQANEIACAERLLGTIQTNPTLKTALAGLGFNDAELAVGANRQAAASGKFNERQVAIAVAEQDLAARKAITETVAAEYTSYRQTVQALYTGAERTALGASGQVPRDLEILETNARAAYQTARKKPYATKLATRSFAPERFTAALEVLAAHNKASSKSKSSIKTAEAATKERNAAVKAMNAWITELKKVAKANLKQKPELLAQLEQ